LEGTEDHLININLKELKEQVPEIIFQQGLDYYKKGQVKITNWDNSSVIASVQDGHPYVVRLSTDERFFETVGGSILRNRLLFSK
jgi:hypothetical protein